MIIDEDMGSPGEGPGVSPDHYAMEDEGEAAICKNTLPTTQTPFAIIHAPHYPHPYTRETRSPLRDKTQRAPDNATRL